MAEPSSDSEQLVSRAVAGDSDAEGQLFQRYRQRLCQMVAVRMEPRLKTRLDPSDVVQEAMLQASRQLSEYMRDRPLPLYAWLRQLTWQHLVDLHHRHVSAQKRSVYREREGDAVRLPDESAVKLAQQFVGTGTSPSGNLMRKELRHRVRNALEQLRVEDCELLTMRHLEQMKISEIAAIMGISESAVKMRRLRAIQELRRLLDNCSES